MKIALHEIARVAHEVNRAYCKAIGDNSQIAWEEAPQWQRDSMLAGVQGILDRTLTSPEVQHQAWLDRKVAEGWTFGEVKDGHERAGDAGAVRVESDAGHQPVPRLQDERAGPDVVWNLIEWTGWLVSFLLLGYCAGCLPPR